MCLAFDIIIGTHYGPLLYGSYDGQKGILDF